MSEFQYYDFRALDRALTRDEREELRKISTRAEITSRRFVNTYAWGNLKADPAKLLARYFDVHIYAANWGEYRLMFRFPQRLVDVELLRLYCNRDSVSVKEAGEFIVLELSGGVDSESGAWIEEEEEEDYADDLVFLRDDILRGDLRALYLGWLVGAQGSLEDEELEPPVPPGLGELTEALESLVEFLDLDGDLLEVAARESKPLTGGGRKGSPGTAGAEDAALTAWVLGRSVKERDALLERFLAGEGEDLRRELLTRFREEKRGAGEKKPEAGRQLPRGKRTVGQLIEAAEELREERKRAEAEKRRQAREEAERRAAREREKRLAELAKKVPATWRKIEEMVQSKERRQYDEAVQLLKDLRDLARQKNRSDTFADQLAALTQAHGKKRLFLERLKRAGL